MDAEFLEWLWDQISSGGVVCGGGKSRRFEIDMEGGSTLNVSVSLHGLPRMRKEGQRDVVIVTDEGTAIRLTKVLCARVVKS